MSCVETPAFARFSIAPAASVAEKAVEAPASRAALRIASMLDAVSWVAAWMFDIAWSKLAAAAMLAPKPTPAASPSLPAAPPRVSRPARMRAPCLSSAVSLVPKSWTDFPPAASWAWNWPNFARNS